MPARFYPVSLDDVISALRSPKLTRKINSVHIHQTGSVTAPAGAASLEAIAQRQLRTAGLQEIAYHLIVDPDGGIWSGRNWNAVPASAAGANGNTIAGPLSIALIGDFATNEPSIAQADSAATVAAQVLARRDLPTGALFFHEDMSSHACPGESLNRVSFRKLVAQFSEETKAAMSREDLSDTNPFGWGATMGSVLVETLDSEALAGDGPEAEPLDDDRVPAEAREVLKQAVNNCDPYRPISPEELTLLRQHVVNLTQGQISSSENFRMTQGEVDAIFDEYLPRWYESRIQAGGAPKVLVYAHGGLVNETVGLHIAAKHIAWWKTYEDVFPVYFIWETGVFETFIALVSRALGKGRDLGARDFTDSFSDPLAERIARLFGGVQLWSGIKHNAELCSRPGGGADHVAQKLVQFMAEHPLELHLAGHSAGANFQGEFVQSLIRHDANVKVKSLQFLAPAISLALFNSRLLTPIKQDNIADTTIYTMHKDVELDDVCAAGRFALYHKSLLYLVSNAAETHIGEPLLGLEESLRNDRVIGPLFGLNTALAPANCRVYFSKSFETTSTSHGDFDDDAPTMNSVAAQILGSRDFVKTSFPTCNTSNASRSLVSWESQLPRDLQPLFAGTEPVTPSGVSGFAPASAPNRPAASGPLRGKRRALCIGIDNYPTPNQLSGCVNDSMAWESALKTLNFDVSTLRNEQATRQAILDTMGTLVRTASPGDIVVLQYAGHGTQVTDENGDEADGDTPNFDEALVPVDFTSGKFLVDDDIGSICNDIPDGVSVTFFLDCCHSGTATRFAVGLGPQPQKSTNVKARFIVVPTAIMQLHKAFRKSIGRSNRGLRGLSAMPEVLFSACLSTEVAYERSGHGDFTRFTTPLLTGDISALTNQEFATKIVQSFGAAPQQHPRLYCAPGREERSLFGL